MNIDTLRYFVELGNSPSLSKSAAKLSISQQGLGKAISCLESELGVELLARSYSGTSLTAQGKRFMPYAKEIVSCWDEAQLAMRKQQQDDPERSFATISPYLSAISSDAAADSIGRLVRLRVEQLDRQLANFRSEQSEMPEFYIVELYGPMLQIIDEAENLSFEQVFAGKAGVIWSSDCPFEGKRHVTPGDLESVSLAANMSRPFSKLWSSISGGIEIPLDFETESWDAIISYACQPGQACLFESCAYKIMQFNGRLDASKVKFTPLIGPDNTIRVGFLRCNASDIRTAGRTLIETTKKLYLGNNSSISEFKSCFEL